MHLYRRGRSQTFTLVPSCSPLGRGVFWGSDSFGGGVHEWMTTSRTSSNFYTTPRGGGWSTSFTFALLVDRSEKEEED